MAKENKREIKIGEVFFIDLCALSTWYYNEEMSFFCSSGKLNNINEDMLIVVKYLGNGILKEMLTGYEIFIDKSYVIEEKFEQDNNLKSFVYADYLEESNNNPKVTSPSKYLETLNGIKELATNYPLAFLLADSCIYEMTKENKEKYLEVPDSVRRLKLLRFKALASKKTEEVIGIMDGFIDNFDMNDELTGDPMLDEAYFENKLFDFKRGKIIK